MAAGMAIVGGIKAVGAGVAYKGSKDAAKATRSSDMANIERMKKENAETIKRTQEGMKKTESETLVGIGGGGFGAGSSQSTYLDAVTKKHAGDLAWLKDAQQSNVDLATTDAANRYSASRDTGRANLVTGLASAGVSGVMSAGRYIDRGEWWS